jgi:hypothetical protein
VATIGLAAVAEMTGGLLPAGLVAPLATEVGRLLARPAPSPAPTALVAVVPGSLGCRPW